MFKSLRVMVAAVVVSAGLASFGHAADQNKKLFVYCAAGVKEPVQEIAKKFETETGVKVEFTFANSGQLLGQIEMTKTGDVYIPGDVGFVAQAEAKKLTSGRAKEFCYFVPAIYVRKGNPKGIKTVTDLVKPGLKLALADSSSAVGQLQAQVFRKNNLDEAALKKNTVASPATVVEVCMAVKMGTVDAGIIWDALAGFAPDEAELVRIPAEKNQIAIVTATALAGTKDAETAGAFLNYLASDKAKEILKAIGFTVEKPSEMTPLPAVATGKPLLVHVGGTMRPAMEEICRLFEKETGVKIEMNYNDSGALITAIETSGKGDVCVVHDPFAPAMEKKGLVDRVYTVALLMPVIAVRKGNPKKIAGVKDLTRPDVKVGLTDAKFSTGGYVVAVVFSKAGIAEAMEKKEIVRARGGGEIANAVKLGTVDAAIVWNAVAFARKADLEAIPIDPVALPAEKVDAVTSATYGPLEMSCIRVTLMTLKKSGNLATARKLADLALSDRGKAIFDKMGFSPAPKTPAAQ